MEIPTAAILKNPDLYEKVKNDLRYSDDGMSRNEAQEYERTRDEQNRADIDAAASAMRTVQEAGEKAERIRDGLRTQFEALGHKKVGKREAEFYSTIWTAAIANEARYAGVDIEEMARRWNLRFQYDRGTGDVRRMRGVYSQPINEGVDPKAEVGIVDVDLGQYTAAQLSTPQELLQYIKSLIGKESMLSRDSKALLGISSNSNAKHLVRSAKPTDTFKEQDARNAALLSIEDIVKNSVLIESFPNRNSKKKHLKNVHRLYVPLRIGDELHTLRVVAHETQDKSGLVPIRADLFDLIVEKESSRPSSDSLSGSTLSSAPPVPTKTGVSTVTIADMLRGVKDAEGRPYVGEEYQQSSARQSEEYDPGDPKTWPEGSARDEALALEAWQNLENDDEVETWPESPEKTEALALRKEYGEIEAWVESHTVEEVLANDELNERGVAIEERLRDLRRTLRKKKPKGAERRLLQLIEAEEEAAAREAETYYQSAYQRQAEEKLAQDEKAWAETVDNFMAGKLIHNRQVRVMTTPIALILAADEGSGFKEIVTTPRILNKILKQKHIDVTPEILKQLPRAMADPILVFKSATVPGSYVSMLELKDERGGTIVVPVALNASKPGEPAFMTSAYGKGSAVEVSDQWFAEQVESGNLRYMNTKKSALWAEDVGLQLPIMSRQPEALHELNIPTEADLVKARGENPGYYQRHSPLTFKLTGKPVSGEYMAVLEKLEAGEPVAADEYNAIPE
ncbi:MAG: hypothetical protein ACFNW0_02140, partial [Fretibacterium sp.]